jgi:hypothetical protein
MLKPLGQEDKNKHPDKHQNCQLCFSGSSSLFIRTKYFDTGLLWLSDGTKSQL